MPHLQIGDSRLKNRTVIKPQPSDASGGLDIVHDVNHASNTSSTTSSSTIPFKKLKTEQEPIDSAVLRTAVGGEAGSKLPVGFGERADPVLANAPVESGEPDI